ncbi:17592_t:CDS:2, partial [Racocetra persica]
DNDASWILEVLKINLREYQKKFSEPNNQQNLLQSNERLTIDLFKVPYHGSRINSIIAETYVPKYVNQQFTLMMILYYGGYFNFYDNDDKADIVADFELMFNLTNFEIFEEAALSKEYLTSAFDPTEINWPDIGRKLYGFYKNNQNSDPINWKKYDFIKNRDNICEEELDR